MEKLVSEISCPVCFNTLRPPVHLCTNGHGVCEKCQAKLENCQLCTQPFSSTTSKNVLLNSVLALLPHECRFDRCQVFVTSEDEDDHEKWCGYQPTSCKLVPCNDKQWTGCAKDLLDHITADHKDIEILNGDKNIWTLDNINLIGKTIEPVLANGHLFWMVINYNPDNKTVDVDFVYLQDKKMEGSFKITLVFSKSKKSYSSSIYLTPENVLNKEESSMTFVYSRIQSLLVMKDSEIEKGTIDFCLTVE